jgi:hypothetical protein
MTEIISLFARGGGGGSSGGGGGGGIIVLPFIIIGALVVRWRRKKQIKKANQQLQVAEASDPTWDSAVQKASQVFLQFQQDWSDFNMVGMESYLSSTYFEHMSLMLEALKQMNRQDRMSNIHLNSATIFNVSDSPVDSLDNFDIEMKASATDQLLDLNSNKVLFTDMNPFTEVWNFVRYGDAWHLDKINQVDAETAIEKGYTSRANIQVKADESTQMRQFAKSNNFFYNADFGWLLLPTSGELFTIANFGRSDINFHVIGKYHDVLVQFYQYLPIVQGKLMFNDYFKSWYKPAYRFNAYVVAQTILPKTYGNIIVKRRGTLGRSYKPSGMTQISLEGVDFNKYFAVYASDLEKVTSFELLNPKYMQTLLDVPFMVNIEIVDNVLYLYSTDKQANFDTMLLLLQNAFEEMKM